MFLRCFCGCLVDIWNYLGSRSAFSGVFVKNMTPRTRKMPAFLLCRVCAGYVQGMFFDLKIPKKRQKKCQKCQKQVEIDSKTIFGAYLPQRGVIYAVYLTFFLRFS